MLLRQESHSPWRLQLGNPTTCTLFAVLSQIFPENTEPALLGLSFRILLIATPLIGSAMAAFTKSFYSSGDWLIMRAGAEEVLKEIYFFRTILKKIPNRRAYLEKRLSEIQRQLYRSMGGELVLEPYEGETVHSRYYPDDPSSDLGFEDLSGEDYFKYRVENQLAWHRRKVRIHQATRIKLQVIILASGGAGAFLAALGGGFSLWVALTASLTAAFLGWQELRNIDNIVKDQWYC